MNQKVDTILIPDLLNSNEKVIVQSQKVLIIF
jgi:hypothetical protein